MSPFTVRSREGRKSLQDLMRKFKGKPFKVESANGTIALIMGTCKYNGESRAYGQVIMSEYAGVPTAAGKLDTFILDREHWKLHVDEPKPVPHYQAIYRTTDGTPCLSQKLFANEEKAKKSFKEFIRLATELESVSLVEE